MFASALSLSMGLVLATTAFAQTIHDVTVGGSDGSLTYSPDAIFANPGDQVVFHFQQKNHTATQSSLADPCAQKEGGFDSGFNPVPANQTDNFPTYTIMVNDTNPIWVFCRQGEGTPASHCGQGMVFAVNCGADGSTNSFTAFQQAALAEGAALQAAASSSAAAAGAAPTAASGYGGYGGSGSAATPASSADSAASTSAASSTDTQSAAPAVHTVVVGGSDGELTFSPSEVAAQPQDIITFEFHQKNHTATQSSFADPCHIMTDSTGAVNGLDSGFQPVGANATVFPQWNVTVNDTTPLWFYCKQHAADGSSHCGSGMVFAVNAVDNGPKNFTAFKALAMQLNGTNATTSSSGGAPSASQTGAGNGAGSRFSTNFVLSLGSVAAIAAALL
ncbi:hypothetical protein CERSUDRAFT_110329 [Gelatoporia subvermispora B]|uniref:Phytocyanin domain-containing protein n=1 Tax=Ceriporiopsis subvermispora (strain B) TaxID=914234 RepID=M2QX95_CERS8|nr:hypothetical protein CERSUDRAFT_110329 [Gelatoporia subvermispora B]